MYKNKSKRRILSLSILILMLSVLSYGTYAFFASDDIATNVITMGNIDITIVEQSDDGTGVLVPFEDVVGVMPGESVSKIVRIQNVAENAAWVRIKVDTTLALADGELSNNTHILMDIDYNTNDWEYREGYWYYPHPLEAGAVTPPLFTKVVFAGEEMGNEYKKAQAEIDVYAQATQYAYNGDTVYQAVGWSEVGGEQ
ncbi:MAG: hypothetical protein E7597_03535 [Ruminococcaceae bacterium]|nr:hypothetical protein [Oscillospiraceae bacterium]